ncbi:MAG: metallophosphoesterase family protein [Chloroflexota bacterium]
MRIAIFSDVHGNLTALETVLADIKQQAPDTVAFAGDLCYFGARPAGCIERIQGEVDLFVYGNTDEIIFDPPSVDETLPEEKRQRWESFYKSFDWYRDKLTPEQIGWLSRMPFSHRISPTASAKDDLLITHANPKDVNVPIAPPANVQTELLGEVKIERDDEVMAGLFAGVETAILAYGHVHLNNVQEYNGITLANISATSNPMARDGTARYGILTWTKLAGWEIEMRQVRYNFGKEQELLSFLQPPKWEMISKGLGKSVF